MVAIQQLSNLARMTVASSGTGTLTLGNAVQGFLTFTQSLTQAGLVVTTSGYQVSYAINDTTNSEIGTGTYYSSNLTLVRTPHASTNGGAAIDMSNAAQVFITPQLSDLWPVPTTGGGTGTTTQQSSNRVLITTTSGVFTTDANLTFTTSAGGGLGVGSTTAGSSAGGGAIYSSAGGLSIGGQSFFGLPVNNNLALNITDSSGTPLVLIDTRNNLNTITPVSFGVSPALSTGTNTVRRAQNWYFNPVTHVWSGAANITGTSSRANAEIVLDQTTQQIGSTAAVAITELNGFYVWGGPIVTATGGFQATVTNNYAMRVGNVGSVAGSCGVVTNAYAGYFQKPSGASNNYSLLTDGAIINTETVNASSSGTGSIQTTGGIYADLSVYGASRTTIFGSVAAPAAGSSSIMLQVGSNSSVGIFFGTGAPTANAGEGSLYLRVGSFTGSTITRLYVASSVAGTWNAVVTVA